MGTPAKRKGKAFWSRVEQAGEAMELGVRLFLGFLFAFMLSGLGWCLGNQLWVGVGVLAVVFAFPVGFVMGFFWLEVKFVFRLILRSLIG